MTKKFKLLESLVQEAVKRLGKLQTESQRSADELKFLRSENARLQAQLRDHHSLLSRNERIRHRLEKLYRSLEKIEGHAAPLSGGPNP